MQPWRLYLLGLILLLCCVVFSGASLVTAQSDSLPAATPTEPVLETPTALLLETAMATSSDPLTTGVIPETLTAETPTATVTQTATDRPPATPTVTPMALEPLTDSALFTITATAPLTSVTDTPTPMATLALSEPTPTASPTATPSPIVLPIDTALPAETPLPTATPTEPPTPTAPPLQSLATPPPHLLITEFLADPKAVGDEQGEWLELYNGDMLAVNLRDWVLADLDNDRHVITTDLLIQPGQYLVLARNGDSVLNGGASVAYTYQNLSLANSSDELILLAPDGAAIDRILWGDGTALTVKAGASYQRTTLDPTALWEVSQEAWPGSAGDQGTPGSAYQPPAQSPTTTPTGTPAPAITPAAPWPLAAAPSALQIDELFYRGSDEELIVLHNTGMTPLDLTGWLIGDAETPGKGEGIYALPAGTLLAGGDVLVLARNGLAFRNRWGRPAHAEFSASDADTPDLVRRRDLASGELALNDSGDEVLLFTPDGAVADVVAFGDGAYSMLGLTGTLAAPKGYALHRVPDARFPLVSEVRHRFLYAPPDPFTVLTLPAPLPTAASRLDGLWLVWGSLGAQSIFSPDGAAPPHYLHATAAAQGLHFLAIADPRYVELWRPPDAFVTLPAWRWAAADDTGAIIYDTQPQHLTDAAALLAYLDAAGSVAQWQQNKPPAHRGLVALAADTVSAPGTLAALYKAWFAAGVPLLPAGNAAPAVPGVMAPAPRYTGLAVTAVDRAGIYDALTNHRGWLTSKPGLGLTLQAQTTAGRHWMGATLVAANEVTLYVDYGDPTGEVAGVAIWQADQPIRQLATPLAGGRWTITVPAMPNSFLYAVATQADGDFAVTAPLYVLPTSDGEAIMLNEVLPAPGADHNGDGVINSDDEYIELYNPGEQPISLAGWQLSDVAGDAAPGRRFTFGPGRYIGGHSYLVLRRAETRINLNNTDDAVRLLNADGGELDQIGWAQSPRRGHSLSRLPDGGAWQEGSATPGQPNKIATDNKTEEATKPPDAHDDEDDEEAVDDEPPPVRLEPTYGQAGGPPASLAQAKLAGLEQWVEFRAVVTAPPGLYNATIYVADPAPDYTSGPLAGIGINIYLRNGEFPPLAEGDRVLVRGLLRSFRGEMELQLEAPDQIWRLEGGTSLQPLPVAVAELGESLEGRLVTFTGTVSGWQGDSIFLIDPNQPAAEAVRVTVRSSLPWRRPYVQKGQRWQVTGIVSQFARAAPWNGGYRVLVRYQEDLVKLKK